jgi:misacylated tRNA(Ala) deacylase
MTEEVFHSNAYCRECEAVVTASTPGTIQLDRTVFYPMGGGQPGDTGTLIFADGIEIEVLDTRKGDGEGEILHIVDEQSSMPEVGSAVTARINWERRYRHMRVHTCLHLLCATVPFGVTGGQIGDGKGRLDFDIADAALDKEAITVELNRLISEDHEVGSRWITDAELEAQPELVRTMSVAPPSDQGSVRLLEIGTIDLQPCGGTHVSRTGEIGGVVVRKIENKGKHNRRVNIALVE